MIKNIKKHFLLACILVSASEMSLAENLSPLQNNYFKALMKNKAVGIAQLYPCFSTLGLSKTWILNDLFVEASSRGHRIGKLLIDATINFAKQEGAKRIDLKTEHDNHTAKTLYEKHGFQRNEIYEHYRFIIE